MFRASAEYHKTGELQDQEIVIEEYEEYEPYQIVYQYRSQRAALYLRNIEKQIEKAKKVIEGKTSGNRTRFLTIDA